MQAKQYKYCTLIAMITTIILPCAAVVSYKTVAIGSSMICASSLLLPLWFVIGDITTEVYGYNISRKIFWSALLCYFIFTVFIVALINLPSPTQRFAYSPIFDNLIYMVCSDIFAIIIGGFINTYLISKWKILIKGRYFWLRSIGASTIGEARATASKMLAQ